MTKVSRRSFHAAMFALAATRGARAVGQHRVIHETIPPQGGKRDAYPCYVVRYPREFAGDCGAAVTRDALARLGVDFNTVDYLTVPSDQAEATVTMLDSQELRRMSRKIDELRTEIMTLHAASRMQREVAVALVPEGGA